jgi:hypothetical protein
LSEEQILIQERQKRLEIEGEIIRKMLEDQEKTKQEQIKKFEEDRREKAIAAEEYKKILEEEKHRLELIKKENERKFKEQREAEWKKYVEQEKVRKEEKQMENIKHIKSIDDMIEEYEKWLNEMNQQIGVYDPIIEMKRFLFETFMKTKYFTKVALLIQNKQQVSTHDNFYISDDNHKFIEALFYNNGNCHSNGICKPCTYGVIIDVPYRMNGCYADIGNQYISIYDLIILKKRDTYIYGKLAFRRNDLSDLLLIFNDLYFE